MRNSKKALQIVVKSLSSRGNTGWLEFGCRRFPCALGRSGTTVSKSEGDGASPRGTWRPLNIYYRADRMIRPICRLNMRPIRKNDGWCDAVNDRNYNRAITHPYPASAEKLWRKDHLYDLIVTLDHNTRPRCQGRGSAIFIHAARPDFAPTEGCIALHPKHLKMLVALLHATTQIKIGH